MAARRPVTGFSARMKNVQVINGALNCTFSVFQATDEEFALLFPEPRQDIQYVEDLARLAGQSEINSALRRIWERPIRKSEAHGIHGTLFYQLERYKKWYRKARGCYRTLRNKCGSAPPVRKPLSGRPRDVRDRFRPKAHFPSAKHWTHRRSVVPLICGR